MMLSINAMLVALIAVLLGMLGAYFTNWEQEIYFEYLKYIVPPVGVSSLFFLFFYKEFALFLGAVFIMGLSWYYSTKLWFVKK